MRRVHVYLQTAHVGRWTLRRAASYAMLAHELNGAVNSTTRMVHTNSRWTVAAIAATNDSSAATPGRRSVRALPTTILATLETDAPRSPTRSAAPLNGLLLRSDLHRLFDRGLVTIEPERLTFRVSDRIRDEYSNGRVYYELEGRPLVVLPEQVEQRPNRAFLEHHRSVVFRS